MKNKSVMVAGSVVLLGVASFFVTKSIMPQPAKKIIEESPKAGVVQVAPQNTAQSNNQGNVIASLQNSAAAANKYSLESATFLSSNGLRIIREPDDLMVLVNKSRNLQSNWEPDDLVIPNVTFAFKEDAPRKKMRKTAAEALEELFSQAKKDKINIVAISGYRAYDTQKRIYESNVKAMGEKAANQVSARPGQSEHQTGLAMDVTSASVNYTLEETFANTAEGRWLKENAAKFGFILRYPKGKENITKYNFEPWHVRYVGKEVAEIISSRGLTLEEYLNAVD